MGRRRTGVSSVVALAVCALGEIVAALLITHERVGCGSDIDRLIELVCHDISYPYRGLGVVLAVVFAVLGVALVTAATVHSRRSRTSFSD